ncbi:hypothetical protein BJ165DRAFT_1304215, partial [Panaeolus papilionaceus]
NLLLEEEQLLAARLCALRGRLNDMAAISSLPPEVLEEVFHYCVACLYDTQPLKSPLAWTQVCRRWRLISLNSTRLWQCIDLCNARFAKEFLLRCKQAPLSLVSTSLLKYHFDSMTINANQLYSIDIFLFHADMVHLFSCIKDQLGSLTRLSLKVPPSKPLILQDVSFPKVRYLALDGVVIDWGQFQDLLRLSIRGLNSEYLPSISSLQSMLRRSPDLLSLRLENYLPAPQSHSYEYTNTSSHWEMDNQTTRIPLLRLSELVICTNSSVASALFSVLCLGPSAKIQLFSSFDEKEDLHNIFPNGLPYSISSLNCRSSTSQYGLVRRIRLSRSASSSITSPLASRLCTSLPALLTRHPPNHTFYTMLQITHLELNTGVLLDLSVPVLEGFLREIPNLEGLAVGFNDLTGLLSVLGATNSNSASSCSSTLSPTSNTTYPSLSCNAPLVPNLKRLTFSRPADLWWNFADRWLSLILNTLEAR